jgi:RimJ/RimL family protein N-acetyltransferase
LDFPDPPLGDEAIRLRPWSPRDAEAAARAAVDPAVQRFTPIPAALAPEWIALKEERRRAGTGLELVVSPPDGDAWLGGVLLLNVRPDRSQGEIGYWLAPENRGRGLAARAVGLLMGWALAGDGLGLGRLELVTHPENAPSRRLAERSGFVHEGSRAGLLVYARSSAA